MTYIRDLLEEVWRGDPVAAIELADYVAYVLQHPDRTVADAFSLSTGKVLPVASRYLHDEPSRDERQTRDALYRRLARSVGNGLSLRKQAEAIRSKQHRYVPLPADQETEGERGVLWKLNQIGAIDMSERQMRRILGGR